LFFFEEKEGINAFLKNGAGTAGLLPRSFLLFIPSFAEHEQTYLKKNQSFPGLNLFALLLFESAPAP